MPKNLIEINDAYKDNIPEWLKKSLEAFEAVPYIEYIGKAYSLIKWIKCKRIELFFRTVSKFEENFNGHNQKRFKNYIESEEGSEILADYADSVIKTSSKIAISSLAILYSDYDSKIYSKDFKVTACLALQGISDNIIDFFLKLSVINENKPKESSKYCVIDGPYPVYFMCKELENNFPTLKDFSSDEFSYSFINELIRRGILLPDHYVGRYGGTEMPFGIGMTSQIFKKLFMKAKKYLLE